MSTELDFNLGALATLAEVLVTLAVACKARKARKAVVNASVESRRAPGKGNDFRLTDRINPLSSLEIRRQAHHM